MKKRLGVLLALVLLVTTFAPWAMAEGSGLSGTITFLSGETDEEQVLITRAVIAAFEKENPNCKIELVLAGMDDREESIMADLYAGAPVDLITVDAESIGTYANAGILHPLDDLIQEVGEEDFIPGSRLQIDGHDYGFPYAGCSMMMYVRNDLLQAAGLEVPTTWSELLEVAKALTKDGLYGACLPAGQNNATTLWANMFINMAGGNVCGTDLQPTLNTQPVEKALQFYKDLAQYCPEGISSYGYGDQITAFCSGKAAITFYQGRVIARVFSEAPDLLDDYGVYEIPTSDDGAPLQFASYNYYALGASTQNPDLAKAFLKYLCTGQNAADFALSAPGHITPSLYSVKTLLTDIVNTSEEPIIAKSADKILFSFDHAASEKGFNESANAGGVTGTTFTRNGILNTNYAYVRQHNILSAMVQQVLLNNVAPADAAAAAQAQFVEVLEDLQ
ncbi:MAG: sugar ABC transporter substrate-binding protein [Candidatus Limiplasma sp.]|nr:sugar ABC transporter substrate-binding protein [Candidatus Limiplasma sp.]